MSGGDFPLVRPDGVIDFDARYLLEAEDGEILPSTCKTAASAGRKVLRLPKR